MTLVERPEPAAAINDVIVQIHAETDRDQLGEIVQRGRDGRLRPNVGTIATLDDAVGALNPTERRNGKTIIQIRP